MPTQPAGSEEYDRDKGLFGDDPRVQMWWRLGLKLELWHYLYKCWEDRTKPREPPSPKLRYRLKEEKNHE